MIRPLLYLLAMLLAGCAVSPLQTTTAIDTRAWELRQSALRQLERWSIKGRMAFNTDKESWTVTLHWQKEADRFQIRMIAPLGQGTWELTGDQSHVRLTTEDNEQYEAVNAEALLRQTLGWELPLQGLEYWIRGIPQPDIPMEQIAFDRQGRMINLQQAGWQITILKYDNIGGTDLPGKVYMSNDHFTLKLVIKDWQT